MIGTRTAAAKARGARHSVLPGPALLLFTLALPASAQTMRDYAYSHSLRGERQLRAVVVFAAGRLMIRRGATGQLYGLTLTYDADRFRPLGSYNAATAEVRLGVEGIGGGGIRVDLRRALPQAALVEFPASVELSLDVTVGASEATLELSGLRLSDLDLKIGASRSRVNFAVPNEGHCRSASVAAGAGALIVNAVGNSGCRVWRLEGGLGAVTLDLSGAWPADGRMTISTALGGIKLIAPKQLGLRVRVSGLLAGFDATGFSKQGGSYVSTNYAKASRHVEVEVSSAIGGVSVEWR